MRVLETIVKAARRRSPVASLPQSPQGIDRRCVSAALRFFCVVVCVGALLGVADAQTSSRQKPKTPRALALVEWPAKGVPRVVPICILVDGRYYDASIYMANPVPLALDPGNVYQVEQSGDPVGFVTITDAKQPQGGQWFADARFRPLHAPTTSAAKAEPAVRPEVEQGPPKLRKGKPGEAPAPAEPKPATAPPETKPSASSEPAASSKPGEDEGRPVLRKPAEPAPAAPEVKAQPAASEPDQSGRPILRRGGRGEQAASLPGSVEVPAGAHASTSSTAAKAAPVATAAPVRVLPAISDEAGPEPKPYAFHWTEQEHVKLSDDMQALAEKALQKYAAEHGGRAGKLENVEVRAFDLTYNNEPVLVLTAAAHPAPPPSGRNARATQPAVADASLTYWITLLAREDLNGDLRLLQAWATDSKHLDAFPRRELIDAVDVDGDGRGELLFRLIWDRGRDFAVYRVRYDQVTQLYSSGRE